MGFLLALLLTFSEVNNQAPPPPVVKKVEKVEPKVELKAVPNKVDLTDITRAGKILTAASAVGVMVYCKANVTGYIPAFDVQEVLSRLVPASMEYLTAPTEEYQLVAQLAPRAAEFSAVQGIFMILTPTGQNAQLQAQRIPVSSVSVCQDAEKFLMDESKRSGIIPGPITPSGRGATLNERLPLGIRQG